MVSAWVGKSGGGSPCDACSGSTAGFGRLAAAGVTILFDQWHARPDGCRGGRFWATPVRIPRGQAWPRDPRALMARVPHSRGIALGRTEVGALALEAGRDPRATTRLLTRVGAYAGPARPLHAGQRDAGRSGSLTLGKYPPAGTDTGLAELSGRDLGLAGSHITGRIDRGQDGTPIGAHDIEWPQRERDALIAGAGSERSRTDMTQALASARALAWDMPRHDGAHPGRYCVRPGAGRAVRRIQRQRCGERQ